MLGISSESERLTASQEGLSSMELMELPSPGATTRLQVAPSPVYSRTSAVSGSFYIESIPFNLLYKEFYQKFDHFI
jgi:hypothetical protein